MKTKSLPYSKQPLIAGILILMISIMSACSTTDPYEYETTYEQHAQSITAQQEENVQLKTPRLLVDGGIIYLRRAGKNQLVEMVVNTNDPKLELEIELNPIEPDLQYGLPSTDEDDNNQSSGEIASSYFVNAQGYFLNRQYKRALLEINRAIKENPKSSIAWSLKGSIHYKRKENGLARLAWQRALKLNPDAKRVQEMLNLIGQ